MARGSSQSSRHRQRVRRAAACGARGARADARASRRRDAHTPAPPADDRGRATSPRCPRHYAVSFAKNYARMVGLDAGRGRARTSAAELNALDPAPRAAPPGFEPGDPARVLARAQVGLGHRGACCSSPGTVRASRDVPRARSCASLVHEKKPEAAAAGSASAPAATPAPAATRRGGGVHRARAAGIWVKFYDADGLQLMQKQMALRRALRDTGRRQGPAAVDRSARRACRSPSADGRCPSSPKQQTTMKDVPVTAEALLARAAASGGRDFTRHRRTVSHNLAGPTPRQARSGVGKCPRVCLSRGSRSCRQQSGRTTLEEIARNDERLERLAQGHHRAAAGGDRLR